VTIKKKKKKDGKKKKKKRGMTGVKRARAGEVDFLFHKELRRRESEKTSVISGGGL